MQELNSKVDYSKKELILLFLIFLFSLFKVGSSYFNQPYTGDEFFSFELTRDNQNSNFFSKNLDIGNPPLYFFTLKNYLSLFPYHSEFISRSLSLVFLSVSYFFIIKISENIYKSKKSILLSVLLFSTSVVTLTYYNLARPYPMYLMFFIISLYLLNSKPTKIKTISLIVTITLGTITHYVFYLNFLAFFLLALLQKNKNASLAILVSFFTSMIFNFKNIYTALFGENYRYEFNQIYYDKTSILELIKTSLFQGIVSYKIIVFIVLILLIVTIIKINSIKILEKQKGFVIFAIIQFIIFYSKPFIDIFPVLTYQISLAIIVQLSFILIIDNIFSETNKKIIFIFYGSFLIYSTFLRLTFFSPEITKIKEKMTNQNEQILDTACYPNMERYYTYYLPNYQFDCINSGTIYITRKTGIVNEN
ncbi:MAG: hypothetical protein IT416_01685 [Candidatus Pacebacteria bacterium]|nr:hypothetical protein [Candidatus Paceibacterota bacterium]